VASICGPSRRILEIIISFRHKCVPTFVELDILLKLLRYTTNEAIRPKNEMRLKGQRFFFPGEIGAIVLCNYRKRESLK
jgi:hypothetical protein